MRIRVICHFVFLLSLLGTAQTTTSVNFHWQSAETASERFENAVLLVPFVFSNDTTTYFLQLDTGAEFSSLYSRRLTTNLEPGLKNTSLGKVNFRKNSSIPPTSEDTAAVGTLGADFLQDKILLIDFPQQILTFVEVYDKQDFTLQPFETLNGRPVVKIHLNGKPEKLLYDTGSSLFGIWTSKRRWKKLNDQSLSAEFPISSWGKIHTGHYSPLDEAVYLSINGSQLKELNIWYVDNRNFKRFFRRNKLYGILGNQAFQNGTILLDFRTRKFGIQLEN